MRRVSYAAKVVACTTLAACRGPFDFAHAFHSPLRSTSDSRHRHPCLSPPPSSSSPSSSSSSSINDASRPSSRRRVVGVQLALHSGDALVVGAVVAGAAAIAASRGLSTLAGAFKLADYRTTSGHDLCLDEKLQSKRRRLLPSEASPGSSAEGGLPGSGLGEDMDWREEIRLASQLPDYDNAAGMRDIL
ncbi:unnamed protein product [Pylaiella littoralis]